jgi:inorganic pyrophosphatase
MKRKSLSVVLGTLLSLLYLTKNSRHAKNGLLSFSKIGTEDFRVFLTDSTGKSILSFWHDIPLRGGDTVNMVVEIPRLAREKMEINKTEPMNPIFHDIRNGKLRYLHSPLSWHYGSVPQTLGDDGDPLDILDISDIERDLGDVVSVKILGALPLLDGEHFDWKIIAIAADTKLAAQLNDLDDLRRLHPGVVSGIEEFFRWYDFPDTKRPNQYAGAILGSDDTQTLIQTAHVEWSKLYRP